MQRIKTAGTARLKSADEGIVEAVFATLDVVDHDGDMLKATSFDTSRPIVVSAYGHSSHTLLSGGFARLPVGKGRIEIRDGTAVAVMKFFLDTDEGRDTFTVVKNLIDDDGTSLQEWSFNLLDVKEHRETIDGQRVNVIDSVYVKEVSPVLIGAGIDTRTLIAKARSKQSANELERSLRNAGDERWASSDTYVWLEDWDVDDSTVVYAVYDEGETLLQASFTRDDSGGVTLGDEVVEVGRVVTYAPKSGQRFVEQAKSVVADVRSLVERAAHVVALRSAKGRDPLSDSGAEVLHDLDSHLAQLRQLLSEPEATTSVDKPDPFEPTDALLSIAEMEVSL